MKVEPILPGGTFHIYNRGNNREILFPEKRNYVYFIRQVQKYLPDIAEIYAYCLLPNHFHLALRIKDMEVLPVKFQDKPSQAFPICLTVIPKQSTSIMAEPEVCLKRILNE